MLSQPFEPSLLLPGSSSSPNRGRPPPLPAKIEGTPVSSRKRPRRERRRGQGATEGASAQEQHAAANQRRSCPWAELAAPAMVGARAPRGTRRRGTGHQQAQSAATSPSRCRVRPASLRRRSRGARRRGQGGADDVLAQEHHAAAYHRRSPPVGRARRAAHGGSSHGSSGARSGPRRPPARAGMGRQGLGRLAAVRGRRPESTTARRDYGGSMSAGRQRSEQGRQGRRARALADCVSMGSIPDVAFLLLSSWQTVASSHGSAPTSSSDRSGVQLVIQIVSSTSRGVTSSLLSC